MLARWLLLLLVAFDVLTSPFHGHFHDAQRHGAGHREPAVAQFDGDGDLQHAGPAEAAQFAHSMVALRPDNRFKPDRQPAAVAPGPAATVIALLAAEPREVRMALPDRMPIGNARHWRPSGRAPPVLHG